MTDIELVIRMHEKDYQSVLNGCMPFCVLDAIANGTPLPKGHDRLIESDSLIKAIEEKAKRLSNADTINGLCCAVALIFDAPTIIEADITESEV